MREVSLTGKLFAVERERFALFTMGGSAHRYLACFSSQRDLLTIHRRAGVPFTAIQCIRDGAEFLDAFPRTYEGTDLRVLVDPRFLAGGRVRWTMIAWN